jgi:acyl-CoA reductase-like NAD-dependent aldehyde dehydrogenase
MAPSATADLSESSAIPTKLDFTTFHNIINGKLVGAKRYHAGINPATKEKLWSVPAATKEDLDDAVIAARAAFKKWKNTTREERNAILLKYADAIEANKEEFSRLLTTEQGKPTFQADNEIDSCVAWLRAQTAIALEDEILEDTAEKKLIVRYTPLGIVGGIIPWNFPAMLLVGKM